MNSKLSNFAKKSSRQRKRRERDWIISLNQTADGFVQLKYYGGKMIRVNGDVSVMGQKWLRTAPTNGNTLAKKVGKGYRIPLPKSMGK